ncbi:MAG: ATP-binding cassette domain-containing protein [Clostridia bacterium]|nr:ATP-binding cassette domain-containing protein [Clostridia bacterium]
MKPIIEIKKLTKDYGEGRGVFDVDLTIYRGETFGFVGTNGSGKTTTIRNIMGFLQPTSGAVYVNGKEARSHSSEIVRNIGYVPGEIAFPDLSTGTEFLRSQAEFLHTSDMSYAEYLIEKLQLDPRAPLKRMSKGMKQKTAIVAALMANPSILILDEPTTGLDPLMRDAFLEIVREEHDKGTTIFMSSHMFGELETTCDRVALIRNGYIIDVVSMQDITHRKEKEYKIEFSTENDYIRFKQLDYTVVRDQPQYHQATVSVTSEQIEKLLRDLTNYNIKFISEVTYNLERHFKTILNQKKENETYVR